MVTDQISDFIIKIKNAAQAGKPSVSVSYSGIKNAIASVLEKEGYVKNETKKDAAATTRKVEVSLVYEAGKSKIHDIARISKISRRLYSKATKISPFKNGRGRTIITTSKGVMTDRDARKQGLGGELLFKIW